MFCMIYQLEDIPLVKLHTFKKVRHTNMDNVRLKVYFDLAPELDSRLNLILKN